MADSALAFVGAGWARRALGFLLLFAALKLGGGVATTGLVGLLCAWALSGKRQALQALALMAVVKSLNPALYSYTAAFGPLCALLVLLAGFRVLATAGVRGYKTLPPLLLFCLVVAVLSAAQDNRDWDVSAMKLFMFGYGGATLLAGFASLDGRDTARLASWLSGLTVAVVLGSLAILPFHGLGYGTFNGFRGLLSHPQTLGPFLTPLCAWLLAGALFRKKANLLRPILAALALLGLMVLTQARTSVVATCLALATAFLVAAWRRRLFRDFRMGRFLGVALAGCLALGLAFAASPQLRGSLTTFVFKHHANTLDKALSSRSAGVAAQWDNFLEHPWTGTGFGVYAWGGFPAGVVRVMGIPISAPVEKGFLPTAILEETGVFGAMALLYLLVALARRVGAVGDPRWMALFCTCACVNVGEMVFFSLGGIGLYFWLLIGLCVRVGQDGATRPALRPAPRTGIVPPAEAAIPT